MDVDYDVVKTVRELEKEGHDDDTISEKLSEMGFSSTEIKEIMELASGVDNVEKESQTKRVMMAFIGGFIVLVVIMAVYAIFLA